MQAFATYSLFYVNFKASPTTASLLPLDVQSMSQVVIGSTTDETSEEAHLQAVSDRLAKAYRDFDPKSLTLVGDNRHERAKVAHWIPDHNVFIISQKTMYSPYIKHEDGIHDKSLDDLFPNDIKAKSELKAIMSKLTNTNNVYVK
jgi:hypothetical protein